MRAVIMTFLLLLTSRAVADCGNLCNEEWWKTAVISDVNDELHAGVNVMARNTEGSTPLHSASMYGTDEMIQLLLNAGADIAARNECDSTPLHSAASNGPPENIQALLDGGADIMAQEADGWTPLHRAAAAGRLWQAGEDEPQAGEPRAGGGRRCRGDRAGGSVGAERAESESAGLGGRGGLLRCALQRGWRGAAGDREPQP